jgi:hypothetical protein
LIGLGLIGILFRQVNLGEVSDHLHTLGWPALWIFVSYGVGALCDCQGWACTLRASAQEVPLFRLYLARLAGETVNKFTPAGDPGGEPLKVYLLQTLRVPPEKALASLVIARTALVAGQIIFILLGVPFFLHRLGLLRQGGVVLLPLLGLGYLFVRLLIRLQQQRLLTRCVRRLAWALPWLAHWEERARTIDVHLGEFYHTSPHTFLLATLYSFLGWLPGAAEIALILF